MSQHYLNAGRMAPMAVTAVGAAFAGHYGKEVESEKQKQLELEALVTEGPSNRIKSKLGEVASVFKKIRSNEEKWIKNKENELGEAKARADEVKEFAEEKLPSQEKEIKDLFQAVVDESRKRNQKQAGRTGGENEGKAIAQGARSAFSKITSRLIGKEPRPGEESRSDIRNDKGFGD